MRSTLVSISCHVYVHNKVLRAHPRKPELNNYLAHIPTIQLIEATTVNRGGRPLVLETVFKSIFERTMILKGEFSDTCQLRTHVDANEDELTIVCDYSEHDLLSLARKCIFQQVGQAVDSFHAKNWIHSDMKPDKVMVDCMVLSDLACALELAGEKFLNARIENGPIGKGIRNPSDVFSYGFLARIEPELKILGPLITYLGPVPPELVAHILKDYLTQRLVIQTCESIGGRERIPLSLDAETKSMTSKMTKLNPVESHYV
ncbi:hypothetical protein V8F44DRAFT_662274 [Aspergillus fumigatus]